MGHEMSGHVPPRGVLQSLRVFVGLRKYAPRPFGTVDELLEEIANVEAFFSLRSRYIPVEKRGAMNRPDNEARTRALDDHPPLMLLKPEIRKEIKYWRKNANYLFAWRRVAMWHELDRKICARFPI